MTAYNMESFPLGVSVSSNCFIHCHMLYDLYFIVI
jgi:hypothetical protein